MWGRSSERERVAARVRALLADYGQVATAPPAEGGTPVARPPRYVLRADRRSALAVGCVALLAALVTGWWVFSSRPAEVPTPDVVISPVSAQSRPSSGARTAIVVVDVEGKVRRPGLYRLAAGSRIADALRAAGGARRGVDTAGVNLAAKVVDGQQIVVGGAPAGAAPGPAASGGGGPGLVNLNTASVDELQTLPGVGPVLAQRIVDWRGEHGGFASVDQLDDVSGIGTVTFAALRERVTV